jgi:hypothetical protein
MASLILPLTCGYAGVLSLTSGLEGVSRLEGFAIPLGRATTSVTEAHISGISDVCGIT